MVQSLWRPGSVKHAIASLEHAVYNVAIGFIFYL